MICDKCGKEKEVWGKCVCLDCYTTSCRGSRRTSRKMDTFLINEIGNLQQQLAEKDKELTLYKTVVHNMGISGIEEYGINHLVDEIISADVKKIRHQVCEEIREKLKQFYGYKIDGWYLTQDRIDKFLEQIEKGE